MCSTQGLELRRFVGTQQHGDLIENYKGEREEGGRKRERQGVREDRKSVG